MFKGKKKRVKNPEFLILGFAQLIYNLSALSYKQAIWLVIQ